MYITVKEILNFTCLQKAEVLAGKAGLGKEIKCIDIIEVPDVDFWLKEGGFYLTTGYSFKDDPTAQLKLVQSMVAKKATALGIKKGRYLKEISAEVIDYCNHHSLPIISIPKEVPYLDISVPVLTAILDRQSWLLQQGEKIHQDLTEIFLKGGNQRTIAEALCRLIEKPVIIQDHNQNIIIQVGVGKLDQETRENMAQPIKDLPSVFSRDQKPVRLDQGPLPRLVAPVIISHRIFGYVSIPETDTNLRDVDIKALEQASVVLALEMLKEKEKAEVANRLKGELLDDLFSGSYDSPLAIIRRGQYLGWDFNQDYILLVIDIDDFERYYLAHKDEMHIQAIKDIIKQATHHKLALYNRQNILVNKSDSLVVFLNCDPAHAPKEGQQYARLIKEGIDSRLPQLSISIGIGNHYPGIKGLKLSYQEAARAIAIGREVFGKGRIYHYNQLGVYRLLVAFQDDKSLSDFYQEVLGPLLGSDQEEMLATINALVRNFGNKSKAAKELCLHRNSLHYRLQKLKKLLALDLDNPEQWLELYLALKIGQVINNKPAHTG